MSRAKNGVRYRVRLEVYVLYEHVSGGTTTSFISVLPGLAKTGGGEVRGRLESHNTRIKNWTHFSIFEVHDNITREEIREFEALLLGIGH